MKVRAIVAIDSRRGLANERGIPWDLPSDRAYVRKTTYGGSLLMGYRTYKELAEPLKERNNFVFTQGQIQLREGFFAVNDLENFLANPPEKIWIFGGAALFAQTIDCVDEIYITQLVGDFGCTKFFPEYEDDFDLVDKSPPQLENGVSFVYQIWKRKTLKKQIQSAKVHK